MACNASKAPFLRTIAKRGFSLNVCPRPVGQTAEIESSVLGNKIIVAAAESSLPVARVSIAFRAGSRNESYENQGAAHMLRVAAKLTNANSTGFAVQRNIQQIGGSLEATNDRELVTYTVIATADHIETGLKFLQDVIQPTFKPWEVQDSAPLIRNQLATRCPQTRAVELLHKAAFRTGLGNSATIPKYQIGKISTESLQHYAATNLVSGKCAVVGVGVDHNALTGFAQDLDLESGSTKSDSAIYYGGDARKERSGNRSHVAVAGLGGSLLNQKEALAFGVLRRALGASAVVKRGNIHGNLGKALASTLSNSSVTYRTINANYADTGLFGFVVSADAQKIGKAIDALTKVLKSGSVSAEDVNRGKAQLKTAVLKSYATDSSLLEELTVQAAITRNIVSADALIAAIDAITLQDVQEAAKKVAASKLSVGAIGNLANVPYSSDLA